MLYRTLLLAFFSVQAFALHSGDAIDVKNDQAELLFSALGAAGSSTVPVKNTSVDAQERYANSVKCTQTLGTKMSGSLERVTAASQCIFLSGNRRLAVTLSPAISDVLFRALKNAEIDMTVSSDGTKRSIVTRGISCRVETEWTRDPEFLTQPSALTENFSCTVLI